MSFLRQLPQPVAKLIQDSLVCEYATLSAKGDPIDTPTYYFPSESLETLDLATGLAYPTKADRARRNPKVGLFIEGLPDEPVVSIAGHAAVRDADLQSNLDRYLAETSYMLPGGGSWEFGKKAQWYWTRIIVEVTPVEIRWWNDAASMSHAPHVWKADPSITLPSSDPGPKGAPSKAPDWKSMPWTQVAERAVGRKAPAHLTLCSDQGFPLPARVRRYSRQQNGFLLEMPAGLGARPAGPACLTFEGMETFLGTVHGSLSELTFEVARALPMLPLMEDNKEVFMPAPHTRENLMRRLTEEVARRGQLLPIIPQDLPPPTRGAQLRRERLRALSAKT
jgi:hypothetical protein